jgi:hypothetical protein
MVRIRRLGRACEFKPCRSGKQHEKGSVAVWNLAGSFLASWFSLWERSNVTNVATSPVTRHAP